MDKKRSKILVVDDETDIVSSLRHFLSTKGYEALGALSGEQALGILEKENVDLILLDMMMPGLKGTDVARIVKAKYPSIKMIVVTAYPDEGQRLVEESKLEGLFIKPVGIQQLQNKLADILSEGKDLAEQEKRGGIKGRLLLIKAKLLFVEPNPQVYNFLSTHFKNLSSRGENYEVGMASNENEVFIKLKEFKPDILIFNISYLNSLDKSFIEKIMACADKPKEVIIYNLDSSEVFNQAELEHLTKTIQVFCFKNGLIEIKWVEI